MVFKQRVATSSLSLLAPLNDSKSTWLETHLIKSGNDIQNSPSEPPTGISFKFNSGVHVFERSLQSPFHACRPHGSRSRTNLQKHSSYQNSVKLDVRLTGGHRYRQHRVSYNYDEDAIQGWGTLARLEIDSICHNWLPSKICNIHLVTSTVTLHRLLLLRTLETEQTGPYRIKFFGRGSWSTVLSREFILQEEPFSTFKINTVTGSTGKEHQPFVHKAPFNRVITSVSFG